MHYIVLYPQNGDRIVTIDSVTLLHPVYSRFQFQIPLPGTMDTKYHFRPRPHNFNLTAKNRSITECDFITRMLFKDIY